MKGTLNKTRILSSLEARMNIRIILAVTFVSVAVLFVYAWYLGSKYEEQYIKELENDIYMNTEIIKFRFIAVKIAARNTARFANDVAEDIDKSDSILVQALQSNRIDAVSIIYNRGGDTEKQEITAFYNPLDSNRCTTIKRTYNITDDINWKKSFINGEDYWSYPYASDFSDQEYFICYSVPMVNSKGERYGMLCFDINLKSMNDLLQRHKHNQDIDVTIIHNNKYVIPPAKEIAEADPEDLIIVKRKIKDYGGTIIFTINKQVIRDKVIDAILSIAVMLIILIITMIIAITLTVRYVAKPFMKEQNAISEKKASMQRELDIASMTQHDLVPHKFPPFPNRKEIEISALLNPAKDVGGDLYDYFISGDTLHFCIGDVSGKGVSAALFMSATHYLFHAASSSQSDIAKAMCAINESLCTDNARCTFVTFFIGSLNLTTGQLVYCNAGHNAPILIIKPNDSHYLEEAENMPLGVDESELFTTTTLQLQSGSMLLLYTDGVTESMNKDGQILGNEETLNTVNSIDSSEPNDYIEGLLNKIRHHSQDTAQSDDITMLCLKWQKL